MTKLSGEFKHSQVNNPYFMWIGKLQHEISQPGAISSLIQGLALAELALNISNAYPDHTSFQLAREDEQR